MGRLLWLWIGTATGRISCIRYPLAVYTISEGNSCDWIQAIRVKPEWPQGLHLELRCFMTCIQE